MKAIQYKRPDDNSNIDDGALQKAFGGQIEYIGGLWCRSRVAILRANGQEIYICYGDWILEIDGVIVALNNEEYQLLQSEQKLKEIKDRIDGEVKQHQHRVRVGIVKPQSEPPKDLGQMISDSIKSSIKNNQQRGGLLAGNKLTEGGYIKPPYITEMENQIKALSMIVSALSCRIEVLDSKK